MPMLPSSQNDTVLDSTADETCSPVAFSGFYSAVKGFLRSSEFQWSDSIFTRKEKSYIDGGNLKTPKSVSMEGEEYARHGSDVRGWKKCARRAEQGKSDDSMTCVVCSQ
ncbi:hypothetical protein NC653_005435 [Populus alba x Populus x berolinensis]|uniref:Uncharacterized protein n=1 Tax=Populus alba x Populus x berolinensis TaxID=444605 RepID=A0AAD6RCA7_9ROSI|nr:hypothetical protein NC653_005435 [Populus alba x Populus x berolinensis]